MIIAVAKDTLDKAKEKKAVYVDPVWGTTSDLPAPGYVKVSQAVPALGPVSLILYSFKDACHKMSKCANASNEFPDLTSYLNSVDLYDVMHQVLDEIDRLTAKQNTKWGANRSNQIWGLENRFPVRFDSAIGVLRVRYKKKNYLYNMATNAIVSNS